MKIKEMIEKLINDGFIWIYKYPKPSPLKDGKLVRVFKSEPYFSIEGGMMYVDVEACQAGKNKGSSITLDIDMFETEEPMKLEAFKNYIIVKEWFKERNITTLKDDWEHYEIKNDRLLKHYSWGEIIDYTNYLTSEYRDFINITGMIKRYDKQRNMA